MKYYEGYQQAREAVNNMSDFARLELIDGLFGRDNLLEDYTSSELKYEALRQLKEEWLTPEGKEERDNLLSYAKALHKFFKEIK